MKGFVMIASAVCIWLAVYLVCRATRHRACKRFNIASIFCFGAFTLILPGAIYSYCEIQRYQNDGVLAEATLTEKWRKTNYGGRAINYSYWLGYSYRDRQGEEQRGQDHTAFRRWEQFKPGHALEIRYLEKAPNHSKENFWDDDWESLYVGLVSTVIFGGLSLWMLFFAHEKRKAAGV